MNTNHSSPSLSTDTYSNNVNSTSTTNRMQTSPHSALKKRILNALKQDEQHNNQILQYSSSITEQKTNDQDKQQRDIENLSKDSTSSKNFSTINNSTETATSGFLIVSPSSSATTNSSTSASSTNTHFNYENLPSTIPSKISDNNMNNSTFQWPLQISQFDRRSSVAVENQTLNSLPSTPYTPPPMLSPFRKGSGLYYHIFSQTTPNAQQTAMAITPVLPFTPIPNEISRPKINIGKEYQAIIPKLQMDIDDDDTSL